TPRVVPATRFASERRAAGCAFRYIIRDPGEISDQARFFAWLRVAVRQRMPVSAQPSSGIGSVVPALIVLIVPSIHPSASRLISAAVRPSVAIGGPITTRIVPGYLRMLWRGQNSPALCATGTT